MIGEILKPENLAAAWKRVKANQGAPGMVNVNGCFDNAPLKRSFLVRGPAGQVFQAFDRLYEEQGGEQRDQAFTPDGSFGADLAGEIGRIRGDEALPESAKNALNLEIARNFQLLNALKEHVPATHPAFIDPGTGTAQPNSWTMRGNSLPDHPAGNPEPWSVANTLNDPARAISRAGVITIDSTGLDAAYYATTAATAPWDMNGTRVVSLAFRLLAADAANGPDGAFQLALGDGSRTWTCRVSPTALSVSGTTYNLDPAIFPGGLTPEHFHTLALTVPAANQFGWQPNSRLTGIASWLWMPAYATGHSEKYENNHSPPICHLCVAC